MDVSETKGFRLFPISIAQCLCNKEAYTYLLLLFKSDFNTGESNVLLETLSNETGYDDETVSGYLHKAEKERFVNITQYPCGTKADGSPKTKNYYKVIKPSKDFIIVNRTFVDMHLESLSLKEETDIKGFVLLVKCICLNNCNLTYYSLRNMAEQLKISYATIQKLMAKCKKLNLIIKDKDCYRIQLDCFDLGNTGYFPKDTPLLYKDIYNTIMQFCLSKGFKAPAYDRKYISMIAAEYGLTRKEVIQSNDIEFIKKNHIGYVLSQRLSSLNEPVNSLNYFVQVLRGKKYEKPPQSEPYTYFV